MKTKEELATECANDTSPIKDIQCPRGCKNPGLYFGFIKGYEAREALQDIRDKVRNKSDAAEYAELRKEIQELKNLISGISNTQSGSLIKRACAYHNYKWPEQLTSGIMFFEGEKITIEQFNRWVTVWRVSFIRD